MKILLTGAAGFIGSHLAERLLARGDEVVGVDNFDPFYPPAEKRRNLAAATGHPRFRLIEADLCQGAELLLDPLRAGKPEAIVHLAGRAGVRPSLRDPASYVRANVLATQTVLDLARRLGVGRIAFASSSSVYGNAARVPFAEAEPADRPVSPYAATKLAAELLCRAHQADDGGSLYCLRLFTVYGPRQRPDQAIRSFTALMAQGRPIPVFGDGSTTRDYTWIDDVVSGLVAAVDQGAAGREEFQIINLGGNRAVELGRLVALLGEAMGVKPLVEYLPPQPGDVGHTWADVTKAERLLGYQPRTPVEEGIPRFVQWFLSQPALHSPELTAR